VCLHLQTQISKFVISPSATSTTLAVATIADYDFKIRSEITGETLSAPFAPAAVSHCSCSAFFLMVSLETRTAYTGQRLLCSMCSASPAGPAPMFLAAAWRIQQLLTCGVL
jgi:hypothetical protein